MKLYNIENVEEFMSIVDKCKGTVELVSKEGDRLKKGDLIGTFDEKAILDAGYRTVTPVIVTNSDDFTGFKLEKTGPAAAGDPVFHIH